MNNMNEIAEDCASSHWSCDDPAEAEILCGEVDACTNAGRNRNLCLSDYLFIHSNNLKCNSWFKRDLIN